MSWFWNRADVYLIIQGKWTTFRRASQLFRPATVKGKISFIMAQMAPLYNCKHVLIVKRVALAVCHQGVCSGEAV